MIHIHMTKRDKARERGKKNPYLNMNLDEKRDLQRYIDMAVDKGLVLDRDEKVQNIRRCTDIRYGILPPQQKKASRSK